MNRRNFLKSIGICAVLPFVGSSSAVSDSAASERQLTVKMLQDFVKINPELYGRFDPKKAELGCKEFRDALSALE